MNTVYVCWESGDDDTVDMLTTTEFNQLLRTDSQMPVYVGTLPYWYMSNCSKEKVSRFETKSDGAKLCYKNEDVLVNYRKNLLR